MKEIQSVYTVDMELQRVVALNLARIRGEMSRKALATKAGVSYQHIYEIEEEIKKPSLNVLEKLSKALDIELADLLASKGPEKKPVKVSSVINRLAAVPDDVYDLAIQLQELKPKDRETAWRDVKEAMTTALALNDVEKA
jgi:transcriptional regulator with XRE-family HTH domain